MAIYSFRCQTISRGKGRCSTAAAAYRSGELVIDERTGQTFDYARRQGIESAFILAPDFAPDWARNRAALWNEVELTETRKDARLAREIVVALPYELTDDERRELVTEFVEKEFVAAGMIADVAIHRPGQDGDRRNHHAHILLTTREVMPECVLSGAEDHGGFADKKNRDWDKRSSLEQWREAWGQELNRALEKAGIEERVDHRSYADRGMEQEGTEHLGPAAAALERQGVETRAGDANRQRQERNAERDRQRQQEREQEPPPRHDAEAARAALNRAWEAATDGPDFRERAEAEGWTLCQGTRREHVAIDATGKIHSLPRLIDGAKAKDVAARLSGVDLPTVAEATAQLEQARADLARDLAETERELASDPRGLAALATRPREDAALVRGVRFDLADPFTPPGQDGQAEVARAEGQAYQQRQDAARVAQKAEPPRPAPAPPAATRAAEKVTERPAAAVGRAAEAGAAGLIGILEAMFTGSSPHHTPEAELRQEQERTPQPTALDRQRESTAEREQAAAADRAASSYAPKLARARRSARANHEAERSRDGPDDHEISR